MAHSSLTARMPEIERNQRVGFFMETSFHYEVYRNIIAELIKRKVSCELVINDLIEPEFVSEMLGFLKTLVVPGLDCTLLSVALKQPTPYDCLLSPYFISWVAPIAKVHIRTLYGLAKESWNHADWNAQYHTVLCYSHYTQRGLAQFGNGKVVGNPRFDDWYQHRVGTELLDSLKLDPAKPTLLYAPTYGELSSLPHWMENVGRLSHDYNVITKLHHGTLNRPSERTLLKHVKRHLKTLVSDNRLTFPLLQKADYVLSDNSGFVFDAIQANKKVILLEWRGMRELLKGGKSFSTEQSPEQRVRAFLPSVGDMVELRQSLAAEVDWDQHRHSLEQIKIEYCDAFQDGKAAQRAADAVLSALS